jgi:hypothetical protein
MPKFFKVFVMFINIVAIALKSNFYFKKYQNNIFLKFIFYISTLK